jgi:hypothetical protein
VDQIAPYSLSPPPISGYAAGSDIISTMIRRIARSILCVGFFTFFLTAADITGIWAGQDQGRRGEPLDVAFRFRQTGQTLTGKLFGDEFDLAIQDASVAGDLIRFTVTTTNYYSGAKSIFIYTGTVNGGEMELIRERVPTAEDKAANRPIVKQTIKLKRID